MKVVIVEDEIRIREGIRNLLTKLSGEYEFAGDAEDGNAGLKLIRETEPDIVITDIRMEGMDGLEMLTELDHLGLQTKAIVLSAYSEFEYARKAMKLGVTEYLLKPISFTDFAAALENVKLQVEKIRQKKPRQVGTPEQIFHSLISGQLEINDGFRRYMKDNYAVHDAQPFIILALYLGNGGHEMGEPVRGYFTHIFSLYQGISYHFVDSVYRNVLIAVVYHYNSAHDLERWIQTQILRSREVSLAVSCMEVEGLEKIKEGVDTIYPYLDWNISLDQEILISYPKILNVCTASCIYPFELENQMKIAVCALDHVKIRRIVGQFHESFFNGNVYEPREVKDCYIRFLWAIIAIAKEVNLLDEERLDQQQLLNAVMNAKLRQELVGAAQRLLEAIAHPETVENVTNLTVKRVTGIIHEFYRTGITLDEIGNKLNITPEYLGTLFHKEMGVTFSTYMKNYRIMKAKELLCGTQLKLYEIAEQVGYQDAKYFSKVFKEVTGQLPTDYRKTTK